MHYREADRAEEAFPYALLAGDIALTRYANVDAAAQYEHALASARSLPSSAQASCAQIDAILRLRTALFPLPERTRILDRMLKAQALAESINDERRLGRVLTDVAAELWIRADYRAALEAGRRAATIADTLGDSDMKARAGFRLGQIHQDLGDYREAAQFHREVMATIERDRREELLTGVVPLYASAGGWCCLALSQLGKFDEGWATEEEVIGLLESIDNHFGLADALWAIAELPLQRGALEEGTRLLERGLALSDEHGFRLTSSGNAAGLGYATALARHVSGGEPLLEQAIKAAAEMGVAFVQCRWRLRLAEIRFWRGRVDDAIEQAEQALEATRTNGERGNEGWALRLLGEITSSRTETLGAEIPARYYRRALELAGALGMRPLVAHCHLGLGRLYRRTGKRPKAEEHLTSAPAMYREMDMRFWLEKVEAEMSGSPA